MRFMLLKRLWLLPAVGLVLSGGSLLAGCKGDAQFSQKEMEQFKQGPPKEMPTEAKKMFEEAMKSGANKPYQPPK